MAYGNLLPYTPRVDKLAETVKQLRGKRKAIHIAREALGQDAPLPQLRSFASYLGRIERGETGLQNPTLDVTTKLAKGLGVRLSEFFALLEGVPTLLDPTPKKDGEHTRTTAVESDTAPPRTDSHGAQVPPNAIDIATLSGAILEAASHIASACDRLATAVAAAGADRTVHQQTPAPRAQSSKPRRPSTRRVRKSA